MGIVNNIYNLVNQTCILCTDIPYCLYCSDGPICNVCVNGFYPNNFNGILNII